MGEKIIGILGGMGPEATIDLFKKIVMGTKVKRDQDHLRILIDNNPKVPDRTLAIERKGPSPLPHLVRSARILENAGADFIVIPCVTAHYYYVPLQRRIKIPILHLVEETTKYIQARLKGIVRIGLIATTGTIRAGLFQNAFAGKAMKLILPASEIQRRWVMEAIYGKEGIKVIGPSSRSKRLILKVAENLIERGAQAILAGCTEVPLVLREGDVPVPVIDPIAILGHAAIQQARGKKR
ncbi:MAG: amino acid racemase [Syntrophaceae bacterium]|nr:amino acid racemase [Syntrophaceae bacterium]